MLRLGDYDAPILLPPDEVTMDRMPRHATVLRAARRIMERTLQDSSLPSFTTIAPRLGIAGERVDSAESVEALEYDE